MTLLIRFTYIVQCTAQCFFLASVEKQIFIFCIKCKCENKKVYERIAPVSHMQIMDFFMTNSKKNEMKWHVQVSEEYDYLGRGRYCCSWSMRLQYTHCFRDFFKIYNITSSSQPPHPGTFWITNNNFPRKLLFRFNFLSLLSIYTKSTLWYL